MAGSPVYIHVDESCLGNQFRDRARPGGAGGLVEAWHDGEWKRRDLWISEPDTTNNRMALRSAIETLGPLRGSRPALLITDSVYLAKGVKDWLPGWKRRGWRRKKGPIENLDLWRELDSILTLRRVGVQWVRGHDGHPENTYADLIATRAAAEQSSSGGLCESGFPEWLDGEREKGNFLDYREFLPPERRFSYDR